MTHGIRVFMSKDKDTGFLNTKSSSIEYVKKQIDSLEIKLEEEATKTGSPKNGTLSRYNRNLSYYNYYKGDFEIADKYLDKSFYHIHESYNEALRISTLDVKQKVMQSIAIDTLKLVKLHSEIKYSTISFVSKDAIKEIFTSLSKKIIKGLIKNESTIWFIIAEALYYKTKRGIVDFVDEDSLVEFIENKTQNLVDIDEIDKEKISWLCIVIFQSAVKRERFYAFTDHQVAERLSGYRKESSERLHKLKVELGAIEDLADSYLFYLLASKDYTTWLSRFKECKIEFDKVVLKKPEMKRFVEFLYIKAYTKGFNLSKDINYKYIKIQRAYKVAESVDRSYAKRLMPYLYITELLIWVKESNKVSTIISRINKKHSTILTNMFAEDKTYSSTLDAYNSIISILQNNKYESRGINTVDSIQILIRDGALNTSDKLFFDLIERVLSKLVNVDIDNSTVASIESEKDDNLDASAIKKLEDYLTNEEGYDIEVKLSGDSQIDKITESICALSNTAGGKIIIGLIEKEYFSKNFPNKNISDHPIIVNKFVLIGKKEFDTFRRNLSSHIKSKCRLMGNDINDVYKPSILRIGEKSCMILDVLPLFKRKRFLLSHNEDVFIRCDNQNIKMKPSDILEKLSTNFSDKTNK